ncbi:DUF1735 domain-containing protein [uncultured Alistipes sp.]|jgi:glycosyl hydrolases family 18|uniref:BT_3987 domain-containing protein n=1 Tax=uncultured Alistipes sp. TaxID=538949 RepID=UPI0025D5BDA3|nr:DUF1735 domain-containing protein [uncultured Alistipes sp.]
MKTMIMNIKHGFKLVCCVTVLASLMACEADTVERKGGKLPDTDPLENTYVKIRSSRSVHQTAAISLAEGAAPVSDRIYCQLTRPAEKAMTITAAADPSLVDAYNLKHGTQLLPLPVSNAEIAANGVFSIAPGERASDRIAVTFKSDGLAAGTYLLPVALSAADATLTDDNRVLYYGVKVRGLELGDYELDADYLNVFYLNTSDYQPLLADVLAYEQMDMNTFETNWQRTYGNIVNLRITQLGYDAASGRALFVLSSDMRYVLEHADKYIRPLQDKGRKVCFCIEGAGTGLGFCNLTDSQIADFTAQVKTAVELYDIDGVHLFDRNASYGKEGMPAMNTTSYPKLVKALRAAMPGKLLTLADYEEPTAYFHDTALTGGIEVGQYIDYAWSGYMSEDEDIQLLDPWQVIDLTPEEAADMGMMLPTTDYDRKPIAGLDPERFGYFAMPFYSNQSVYMEEAQGFMNIAIWNMMGYCPNKILVYADLISNKQGTYEGAWIDVPSMLWTVFLEGGMDMYMYGPIPPPGSDNYTYMHKDW